MSVIVNDRDVRLRSSAGRTTPALDRALLLSASASVIRAASNGGAPAPASVTFTVTLLNMAGDVTWSAVPALDMTINGNTAVIAAEAFGSGQSVVVKAKIVKDGVTYEAAQAVVKVSDGVVAYTWIRYADTAAGAGISNDPTGKSYIGFAYNKSTPIESNVPGDYTWTLIKGEQGVQGPQGYTWIKYSDSPNGANLYDVPTASTLYIGIATNKPSAVESTTPGDYVWSKFKGDQGVQGPQGGQGPRGYDGVRGTVDIAAGGYSYWDDAAATNAVIAAGYGYPVNRDRVTLYGTGYSETRFRDGSSWLTIAAYINGNMLVNGTLSATKVSGGELSGVSINISNQFKVSLSGGTASTFIHAPTIRRGVCDNADVGPLPALQVTSSGSGAAVQANGGGSGNAVNITGGSNGIVQSGGGTNWLSGLNPSTSNAYSLGTASFLWSAIYSSSSTITTSDERTKKDIADSQLGLDFINDLRTIQYRQRVAERIVRDNFVEIELAKSFMDDFGNQVDIPAVIENQPTIEERAGVRMHFGLPAQQVKRTLDKHGMPDAAMWVLANKSDPNSQQALRYEELIAPLIKAVQELSRRLHSLQVTVNPPKVL